LASDRTFVTELSTGLGMLGTDDVGATIAARPTTVANLGSDDWERLEQLWAGGDHDDDFRRGVDNGRAFLEAADALNGRPPRIVEWTGPRRAPGDEVVPADLRVDHVYLVSCKYLSKVLHNASPQRLVEGLLAQGPTEERGDWYHAVAAPEHEALYTACVRSVGSGPWPVTVRGLDTRQRRRLRDLLGRDWPKDAVRPYARLCAAVAEQTAARWADRLTDRNREAVLWRLLRIGSAPYFVLGASREGSTRLRIDTPWDWRQRFDLRALEVVAQPGGQPRVGWTARYRVRATGEERSVEGHVELRWSHGRFSGPPEAKVYLDTPHELVPGYHPLDGDEPDDGTGGPRDSPAEEQAPRLFDVD